MLVLNSLRLLVLLSLKFHKVVCGNLPSADGHGEAGDTGDAGDQVERDGTTAARAATAAAGRVLVPTAYMLRSFFVHYFRALPLLSAFAFFARLRTSPLCVEITSCRVVHEAHTQLFLEQTFMPPSARATDLDDGRRLRRREWAW